LLRSLAQRVALHSNATGGDAAAWDRRRDEDSGKPLGDSNPLPSLDAVIADALGWEPPIAKGSPTPLDSGAALPIATGDHVLGSQLAPITLMLFGDLQCPYALHSFRRLSRRVQEQPTEYRLVWRERPLDIHPAAALMGMEAERLSLQQGEVAFWRYLRALSGLRGSATLSDANVIARALRKVPSKIGDAVANDRAAKQLQSDARVAMAYAIHDTPTVFVNGLRLEGDISRGDLDEVIEQEREAVQELLQEPTPEAKVYATRVQQNLLDLELD
jgi:protein-disulfide isomerase